VRHGSLRRRRPDVEKIGNGRDKLRWRERLGQKDAVGNAVRCPLVGRSASHVNDGKGRVDLSGLPRDFPAVDPAKQIDVSHERAVLGLADLWVLGPHRLLCGDARSETDYRRVLAGRSADLVLTDPPYNVRIDGHVSGLGKAQHSEFAMASGEMSEAEFTLFLSTFLGLARAHSCDGAILFVFMDWRHLFELTIAGRDNGLELKNLIVWAKDNAGMGSFYRSKHELCFVFKNGCRLNLPIMLTSSFAHVLRSILRNRRRLVPSNLCNTDPTPQLR
jgi:hypothetical protein